MYLGITAFSLRSAVVYGAPTSRTFADVPGHCARHCVNTSPGAFVAQGQLAVFFPPVFRIIPPPALLLAGVFLPAWLPLRGVKRGACVDEVLANYITRGGISLNIGVEK